MKPAMRLMKKSIKLEMKTRFKKAKKYNYTKNYEKQPEEIPDLCKKKSLKPAWVIQDRFACTYEPDDTCCCRDETKQHCLKVEKGDCCILS